MRKIHRKATKLAATRLTKMIHQDLPRSWRTLSPNPRRSKNSANFFTAFSSLENSGIPDGRLASALMEGTHLPSSTLEARTHRGQICLSIKSLTLMSDLYWNIGPFLEIEIKTNFPKFHPARPYDKCIMYSFHTSNVQYGWNSCLLESVRSMVLLGQALTQTCKLGTSSIVISSTLYISVPHTTTMPLDDIKLRKLRFKVFVFESKLHWVRVTNIGEHGLFLQRRG